MSRSWPGTKHAVFRVIASNPFPDQPLLYLVSGLKVAKFASFFKNMISQDHVVGICHHEQTHPYPSMFVKHVKSLCKTNIEYGNVLLDSNEELYNVFSGTTCLPSAIASIMSPESVEKRQYEMFVRERLNDRVIFIKATIKNNKLPLIKDPKDSKSKSSKA